MQTHSGSKTDIDEVTYAQTSQMETQHRKSLGKKIPLHSFIYLELLVSHCCSSIHFL